MTATVRYHPGQKIDRYEIEEPLGEGAYAETYKARDTQTDGTVVLNVKVPIRSAPQLVT